jgi:hypothetical protein
MLNEPTGYMTIRTNEQTTIVCGGDSIKTINNKAIIMYERSKEPIEIMTITNLFTNKISIKSKNSTAYWFNLYNLGIGMVIERNNSKRYGYPLQIKLNPSDTSIKVYKGYFPPKKGNLFMQISVPYLNNFYLLPENEGIKANTGFWGLSLGLDYFYSNTQFINFSANLASDFFCPVPAAIDMSGEYEMMSSSYLSLSNNYKFQRFSIGYGISYGKNTWDLRYYDTFNPLPPTREPIKKSQNTFGLVFPLQYQLGRTFSLGFTYRPTLLRIKTDNNFKYEHLISICFIWKIRLRS